MLSHTSSVSWRQINGLPILDIVHPNFVASVSLYGGQVLTWQPKDQEPVFWLSKAAYFNEGKAIRGGVPICWPWFGPYQDGGNHGFARNQLWQLASISTTDDVVDIRLVWQGQNTHALWPTAAKLEQHLSFGVEFSQQLLITNLAEYAVEFSGALHSYFTVSHPENCQIPELSQVDCYDQLTEQEQPAGEVNSCMGAIDRIYHSGQSMRLIDKGLKRVIAIEPTNVSQWVLWNPDATIAVGMKDISENGQLEYVCLEAARTELTKIDAGQSFSLGQRISVLPL